MRTRLELQASQQLRSPNDFGTGQIPGQRCTLEILETNPGLPASVGWGERLGISRGSSGSPLEAQGAMRERIPSIVSYPCFDPLSAGAPLAGPVDGQWCCNTSAPMKGWRDARCRGPVGGSLVAYRPTTGMPGIQLPCPGSQPPDSKLD